MRPSPCRNYPRCSLMHGRVPVPPFRDLDMAAIADNDPLPPDALRRRIREHEAGLGLDTWPRAAMPRPLPYRPRLVVDRLRHGTVRPAAPNQRRHFPSFTADGGDSRVSAVLLRVRAVSARAGEGKAAGAITVGLALSGLAFGRRIRCAINRDCGGGYS